MPPVLHRQGWIEVIAGPMFSGKSEELIRRVKRALIARQRVVVFKPRLDNRYGEGHVVSHDGERVEAIPIARAEEMEAYLKPLPQVVAVDEVQFLDRALLPLVERLAQEGVRVILAGLDLDFRGEPFGLMPELLARAEFVEKLTAICPRCGAPATRTQRLVDGKPARYTDPIILVGAQEHYEPRCRACHQVAY
ncbi:MAG: thymidine kinase [Thermus sp.]|uniref:thymidine kinase n=1 Tax=Thermus sp. TaxID=275 RepID=UPI0025CDB767|nr:thymidine kinase [Thermus sp.]MCS6869262.1 thymidine kinase [Thermus sp.]MCS7219055.1 thymidine kinase [Thermus sp.]MCX7849035.1 thymidine kinase [Thermus sp.]MDW8017390.1 thymidine kinase [Thermus sp.]MDW8357310.1 thymidine kinase [Thermus sp.]